MCCAAQAHCWGYDGDLPAMNLLRTLIYLPFFYIGSALIVIAAVFALLLPRGAVERLANLWGHYHRWCARILLGQRVEITGQLPDAGSFYVFKHESMYETIDTLVLFRRPVVIAKAELLRIPVWGWIAARQGLVGIERDAGPSALRTVLASAKSAMAKGRPLCFFPEGTRVLPGEAPPLKSGFYALYKLMNVPVIPVAVKAGHIVPRHGLIKYPGIVHYQVGEAIPPGLPRAEAESRVHAAINGLNQSEFTG